MHRWEWLYLKWNLFLLLTTVLYSAARFPKENDPQPSLLSFSLVDLFICGHEQESFILLNILEYRYSRYSNFRRAHDNSSFSKDAMHHFQIQIKFGKPRFGWKWFQIISTMHIALSATISKIKYLSFNYYFWI